jgi:hypothetical protein
MVCKPKWSAAARICAGVLLLWALARHPYGYYKLLRWVVCGVSAYSVFEAAELKKEGWAITFGIMALMFNPFIPVQLGRATWGLVDFGAAVLLAVSLYAVRRKES